jgi:hypothetical protein
MNHKIFHTPKENKLNTILQSCDVAFLILPKIDLALYINYTTEQKKNSKQPFLAKCGQKNSERHDLQ